MTVSPLTPESKAAMLAMLHRKELTQEEAAVMFGITRWQVRKMVIQAKQLELKFTEPVLSLADQELLQVARATGLNAVQLQQALSIPPLTDRNIFHWLVDQTPERLARLMFQVVITQQTKQQEAANGTTTTHRESCAS